MSMSKWLNFTFSAGVDTEADYLKFQRQACTELKKQVEPYGFDLHQFNKNHYAFSAVLRHKETRKFVYVSISDVRFFANQWFNRVLIRTMAHEKDWTGGMDNYCRWDEIGASASRLA